MNEPPMGSDPRERRGGQTPHSSVATVDTACPLDCPDSCSLAVTVSKGRVVEIDGSTLNAPTAGYICAKVRKFGDRVYGDARLQYPAVRTGPKGQGRFRRVGWDEAIELIATRLLEVREHWGGEAILPFSYGGSNGLLTQDTLDAVLFRRSRHVAPRAHGMRGAHRRCGAGPLRQDAVGHLRRLSATRGSSSCGASIHRRRASISCRTCARRRSPARGSS